MTTVLLPLVLLCGLIATAGGQSTATSRPASSSTHQTTAQSTPVGAGTAGMSAGISNQTTASSSTAATTGQTVASLANRTTRTNSQTASGTMRSGPTGSTTLSTAAANTSTRTSTRAPTSTADPERVEFDFCRVVSFGRGPRRTARILLYVGSGWAVAWTALCFLVNLCNGVFGHHRALEAVQEAGFVVLFVFLGGFVLRPDPPKLCEVTSVVLYAFLIFVVLLSVMQTGIARSLIRGGSARNGRFPAATYYFWPLFLASTVTVAVYFALRSDFETNGVQCFCDIYDRRYWAITITAALLTAGMLVMNQTAVVLCKMTRPTVDVTQLFWAKKTVRSQPLKTFGFLGCYFACLFAAAMQRLWLFGVYVGVCAAFGPLLFVCHTYGHERTAAALFAKCGCRFYRPCPKPIERNRPRTPKNRLLAMRHKEALAALATGGVPPADLPPAPPAGRLPPPLPPPPVVPLAAPPVAPAAPKAPEPREEPPAATSAQDLYSWLTDKNEQNIGDAENVLFKPPGGQAG